MKNKLIFALEIIWLTVSILSLLAGIYQSYRIGLNKSYLFFIIFFIAILMYLFRRQMRKSRKNL